MDSPERYSAATFPATPTAGMIHYLTAAGTATAPLLDNTSAQVTFTGTVTEDVAGANTFDNYDISVDRGNTVPEISNSSLLTLFRQPAAGGDWELVGVTRNDTDTNGVQSRVRVDTDAGFDPATNIQANDLVGYQVTLDPGFYGFNGTEWRRLDT